MHKSLGNECQKTDQQATANRRVLQVYKRISASSEISQHGYFLLMTNGELLFKTMNQVIKFLLKRFINHHKVLAKGSGNFRKEVPFRQVCFLPPQSHLGSSSPSIKYASSNILSHIQHLLQKSL